MLTLRGERSSWKSFFQALTPTMWFLLIFYGMALIAAIAAPILALRWAKTPFPGFLTEPTLVVTDIQGKNWAGFSEGVKYPQRIIQIDHKPIQGPAALASALSSYKPGDSIDLLTTTPEGQTQAYQDIPLGTFPTADLLHIFWLPYSIGLIYLAIGAWIFKERGNTLAGRAFGYFCITSATALFLLFDLYTTHLGHWLWTLAIAQHGGALISLGLLFPEVAEPVKRRIWVRFIPYIISVALAIWGLLAINDLSHPWRYVLAWRLSYYFTSLGILFFLVVMIYRLQKTHSAEARQQTRIILWGGIFSFIPLGLWFAAPFFNITVRWNPSLFLVFLIIFPISLAVSILRYRLWNIDIFINRTIVYSLLSILLLFVFVAMALLFQYILGAVLGLSTGISNLAAMFVIVVVFNPLRSRIQSIVDRRFYRAKYDIAKSLSAFSQFTRDEIDLARLVDRFTNLLHETMEPVKTLFIIFDSPNFRSDLIEIDPQDALVGQLSQNSHTILVGQADPASIAASDLKKLDFKVVSPIASQGKVLGLFALGERRSEQDYTSGDLLFLDTLTSQIVPAVKVAQLVRQREAEAIERQTVQHEMEFARLIQQTLLPKTPPDVPGWNIAVHYQPARAVGGDFYDFFPLPDNKLVLVVGDVTDKGVPAALLMATTRSILRGAARRMFSPSQALSFANEILIPEMPEYMYVTCMYAILDMDTGHLQYANAGHTPICHNHDHKAVELRAKGMPLGLLPGMTYDEREAVLAPGDGLLLYSDGIVEAHNRKNDMFGFPRLVELMGCDEKKGKEMLDFLLEELACFTGPDWTQEDDITLLIVNWDPAS